MQIRYSVVLLAAVVWAPQSSWAQRPALDEAERLITAGIFSEARQILEKWQRDNPGAQRMDQETQARYHLLSARVTTAADSAEDSYLRIAVNYPTSRVAPEALLRLSQARHARGDDAQAMAYLERLLADYPETDQRPLAAVWLARVSGTASRSAVCDVLRSVKAGTNPETVQHLKNEQARACGPAPKGAPKAAARVAPKATAPAITVARTPAKPDTARTTTKADSPRVTPSTSRASAAGNARVSIQTGAFRELSRARAAKRELERAGYEDVRLVRVPGKTLIRVRIGKFSNRTAAASVLTRLAQSDVSAVLVTDTESETIVRN